MKHITATLLALLFALAAAAAGPQIKFETQKQDFGTVRQSDPQVTLTYEFTNTGDEPLVIISAKASCGCTRPHYPDAPIAPGEKGKITLKFNPRNQFGEISKSVTVRTNDKKHKKLTLRLSGVVIE